MLKGSVPTVNYINITARHEITNNLVFEAEEKILNVENGKYIINLVSGT